MVAADSIPPPTITPEPPENPANSAATSATPSLRASVPSSLSPRDSALLSSLIRSNFDLSQTAFDHGLGLHELTDWLRSPAIQSLAADLLHSAHTFLEIRLARARMATIGILETIAQTSEDPTERRRAAAALFHRPFARPRNSTYHLYSMPPPPIVPPITTPPSAPKTESPSSPAGGGAGVLAGGRGSVSTPSTDSPSSASPWPAPQPPPIPDAAPSSPRPEHHNGASSPCHLATVSPCPPTQDPRTQDPGPSPAPLASALFNAFFARDTNALLHAFSCHSTPDATLDNRPLRETLHTHPLAQMHVSREVAYSEHARSPTAAAYTFTFDRAPLSPSRASFRFEFARDDRGHWLIHAITTLDSS